MIAEFNRKSIFLFFEAINYLSGEGHLHIEKDGMFVSAVDTANIALIFAKYIQPFPSEQTIAVDIQKIKSTIGALSSNNITVNFDNNIHIKGGKVERDIRSLNASTVKKEREIPSLDFPVCVEVPAIDFVNILDSIDKMGAAEGSLPLKLCFEYNKNFTISVDNELSETTKTEFDTISTEKGEGLIHKSYFSFEYVRDIAKMIKKLNCDNIKIYIGTNLPFKIEASVETISIKWLLAPRVDVE